MHAANLRSSRISVALGTIPMLNHASAVQHKQAERMLARRSQNGLTFK
jgi:hypothetical protein